MKLTEISTSRLQNLELGQFIIRFLNDFQNQNLDATVDPDFKRLYDNLNAQSPLFDAALNQIRAKAESEFLLKLDIARDRAVRTLRRAHLVAEFAEDKAEQEAFASIKIVLKTYKDIEMESYEAESLGIDNLIVELRSPKNLAAVQLLGLERYIDSVERSNNIFKTTFDKRSSITISTEVFDSKLLRKNILETYKNLAEYVLAMAKNKNNPFYTNVLSTLNNGRKYFADLIARRNGGQDTQKPSAS